MTKKKEKKAGKHMRKSELAEQLMTWMQMRPGEDFALKQIFRALNLTTHPLKMLCVDILNEMAEDDFIQVMENGHFKLNNHGIILTGKFQRKSNGKNTFVPEDGSEPIFIAERNSGHAMHGDKVKISLTAKRKGRKVEGEVIEILERAKETFVGTLKVDKHYAFLLTEDRTLANDIFIPRDMLKGGKDGDKAVVKVTKWPEDAKNPIGKVIDILGQAGDNTTEMHAILAEYGFPYVYPKHVEAAADKISDVITPEDYAEREDFREITTFTIDPKDAKDFDDALSFRRLENGNFEIGVHIADVSHYVEKDGIIDKDAYDRGTSVYLVDRVIPMLPHKLSNGICSLNAGVDRLALSCFMHIDKKGEVTDHRIVETIINVDRRMTYTDVNKIVEFHDEETCAKYEGFVEFFDLMQETAEVLREKRRKRGSIDFDLPESKIILDEKGKPIEIKPYERNKATRIIENAEKGKAFEKKVGESLGSNKASQITIEAADGTKTRVDFIQNEDGKLKLIEAKSSQTAPLTPNQKIAHPQIEQSGGIVRGKKGESIGLPNGERIPPTKVKIVRPNE
mgnify:CR=1 FL=1